jgi:hypothetical protein
MSFWISPWLYSLVYSSWTPLISTWIPTSASLVNVSVSLRQPLYHDEKHNHVTSATPAITAREQAWIRQALSHWTCNESTCREIVKAMTDNLDEIKLLESHISALEKQYASQWIPYLGKPDHTKSNIRISYYTNELRELQHTLIFCHSTHACYQAKDSRQQTRNDTHNDTREN